MMAELEARKTRDRKCVTVHAIACLVVVGLFAAFAVFSTPSIEGSQNAAKVTYTTAAAGVSGASSHDNDHGVDCDVVVHCHAPIVLTTATKLAEPELIPVVYAPVYVSLARAMLSIASPPPKSS